MQRRGGTARHDAVVWGYARAADQRGVDIIQNCEVTGLVIRNGRITGVETTRGNIRAAKVGLAVAGNTSRLAAMAGLRMPIESHVIQAFVTEGIKPAIDCVMTFGAGHFYISQSDKGGLVFGGDLDGYNTYAQRGNLPTVEDIIEGGVALWPGPRAAARPAALGRIGRHDAWTAVRSSTARRSTASISTAAGTTAASRPRQPPAGASRTRSRADEPHALNSAFRLDRFAAGRVIDEKGAGAQPNLIDQALRTTCGLSAHIAASAATRSSAIWATRRPCAPILPARNAAEKFADYVYLRDNPRGLLRELWYHAAGCHSWLVVTRDTMTHEITSVEFARDIATARAPAGEVGE